MEFMLILASFWKNFLWLREFFPRWHLSFVFCWCQWRWVVWLPRLPLSVVSLAIFAAFHQKLVLVFARLVVWWSGGGWLSWLVERVRRSCGYRLTHNYCDWDWSRVCDWKHEFAWHGSTAIWLRAGEEWLSKLCLYAAWRYHMTCGLCVIREDLCCVLIVVWVRELKRRVGVVGYVYDTLTHNAIRL